MDAALERQIAALAKRQRGYVTRPQLMELGLTEKAIRWRAKTGRLIVVYAGVYAVGHVPSLLQDQTMAALLACGTGAVLSHGTAATVWGIFKAWKLPFEVTAAGRHTHKGIVVHRTKLDGRDATTQLGLRVTSAARTILDIAPRLPEKALRRAVNDLRRPGYVRTHELADLVGRFPRAPGTRRLRPLLDVPVGGPTRSVLEDTFLAFVERFGLPRPQTNVWVAGREVDIWFPRQRVIVELDGWDYHSDRDRFEGDRDHDATALALGIPTVRITAPRIEAAPEREAERLWEILRSRPAA